MDIKALLQQSMEPLSMSKAKEEERGRGRMLVCFHHSVLKIQLYFFVITFQFIFAIISCGYQSPTGVATTAVIHTSSR